MSKLILPYNDEPTPAPDTPNITRGDLLQSINLLALRKFCVGHQPTDVLDITDEQFTKMMYIIDKAISEIV